MLSILAYFFGLLFAIFRFLHEYKSNEVVLTQMTYGRIWKTLNNSKISDYWLLLVNKLIIPPRILSSKLNYYNNGRVHLYNSNDREGLTYLLVIYLVFILFITLIISSQTNTFDIPISFLLWGSMFGLYIVVLIIFKNFLSKLSKEYLPFFSSILLIILSYGTVLLLSSINVDKLFSKFVVIILISPILVPIVTFFNIITYEVMNQKEEKDDRIFDYSVILSLGFIISLILTIFALHLGAYFEPNSPFPYTPQLLMSNFIFDGLTLVVTYKLLRFIHHKRRILYLFPLIICDIVFAIIFAILSLYLGLLGTNDQLSLKEAVYILIGYSANGNTIELGPYFWSMHTVFIPTLIYLLLILVSGICKMIVIPVALFFQRGSVHDKPLYLTAVFFGCLAGVFMLLENLFKD